LFQNVNPGEKQERAADAGLSKGLGRTGSVTRSDAENAQRRHLVPEPVKKFSI
jgi:hypothetical protein